MKRDLHFVSQRYHNICRGQYRSFPRLNCFPPWQPASWYLFVACSLFACCLFVVCSLSLCCLFVSITGSLLATAHLATLTPSLGACTYAIVTVACMISVWLCVSHTLPLSHARLSSQQIASSPGLFTTHYPRLPDHYDQEYDPHNHHYDQQISRSESTQRPPDWFVSHKAPLILHNLCWMFPQNVCLSIASDRIRSSKIHNGRYKIYSDWQLCTHSGLCYWHITSSGIRPIPNRYHK